MLVAGDVVAQSDALAELTDLAECLGVSVFSEGASSMGNCPFSHPLCGGTLPLWSRPSASA